MGAGNSQPSPFIPHTVTPEIKSEDVMDVFYHFKHIHIVVSENVVAFCI